MERFLNSLKGSEGGRRFLINLYWGLHDSLPLALALRVITKAMTADASGDYDDFFPQCGQLRTIIYGSPEDYQFQGPPPDSVCGRWMTVKTADDLKVSVYQGLGNNWKEFREYFPSIDPGASLQRGSDEDLEDMAVAINNPANNLQFSLGIQREAPPSCGLAPGSKRQSPSWLSRWCVFEQSFAGLPRGEAASRLRDWLGLPVNDQPLFAIRTRECVKAKEVLAHRPTVLDGFEGPFYKHRTGSGFPWMGCGSAVDLMLVGADLEIDGGPELVSRAVRFTAEDFECLFLGRATELRYDPFGEFYEYLLPRESSLDDVIARLMTQLGQQGTGERLATAEPKEVAKCLLQTRCSACAVSGN